MNPSDLRVMLTNAISYWERRRILYNVALAAVVLAYFFAQRPHSRAALSLDLGLNLFILAILANVAFSAAYLPDLAIQASGYRNMWLKRRWVLLLLGTAFACAVASFFARAMFGNAP